MSDSPIYAEKDLLLQIAEGDEKAFAQLYVHWQPALSTFIFRISHSKEMTAEIVQDVFLKIWMTREALAEIQNFKSYLFVIARNHAINVFRKYFKENKEFAAWQRTNQENIEAFIDDESTSPNSIIDDAIDQLSARQKEIYLLHRHQRFTYKEIAHKLGIGKESVKTHLQLAVKSITIFLKARVISVGLIIVLIFF